MKNGVILILILLLSLTMISCKEEQPVKQLTELEKAMNLIAEDYVKLALEIGLYDGDYIDAYFGPDEWRPDESQKAEEFPYDELNRKVDELLDRLESLGSLRGDEMEILRYKYLSKQLLSMKGKVFMLAGGEFSFDEEAKILYDAEPPTYSAEFFEEVINELDKKLPGSGTVSERINKFRNEFIIPIEKLDTVFKTAIDESRRRTLENISLPENESFEIEYVNNKPWSGYNWYKGNSHSLIQLNIDFPIFIDRAVDLAAHEGYPGHHVFNILLEQNLYKNLGWVEFCVYVLFSPPSLIAEGTANYGIEVAFPGEERITFEREVLFPLAGLDPLRVEEYYDILKLTSKLGYAGNEASRNYLDGKFSKDEAVDWLVRYSLMANERAEQRIQFIEKYRSYVINYNLGQDIVKDYIERNGGTADNPKRRWELFKHLISTPQVPSGLK